jgi:hypothetical protein
MAGTWLYIKGGDSLEVRRWDRDVGGGLVVVDQDQRTEEWFDSPAEVMEAQRRLEQRLREEGWRLQDFYPDRRTGFDRRGSTRPVDRRRPTKR